MSTFDRDVVQGSVEQMYPVNMGLYELFFGGKDEDPVDTKHVDVDFYKGSRRISKYTKRGLPGQQVENTGFQEKSYTPPLMKPHKMTDAEHFFTRDFGKTPFDTSPSPEQRAYAKLGKDFEELKEMCERTKLVQAAEALTAGTVTIEESGVTRTIDFGMPSSHKVTLSGQDLWTDTTNSDPLQDIRDWKQMVEDDSGLPVDAIVFGTAVAKAYKNHPKVQAFLDNRRIVSGELRVELMGNGLKKIGEDEEGTPIYTFPEKYDHPDTGVSTPVLDTNRVIMGSTDAYVRTHYAAVTVVDGELSYPAALKEYTDVYLDRSAGATKAEYQTAPLVALSQSDAFMSAVVVA